MSLISIHITKPGMLQKKHPRHLMESLSLYDQLLCETCRFRIYTNQVESWY